MRILLPHRPLRLSLLLLAVTLPAQETVSPWRLGTKSIPQRGNQVIDLTELVPDDQNRVELECTVESPRAKEVLVSCGFDDALWLFVNGEEVFVSNTTQPCTPNQHLFKIKLRAGTNLVRARVVNKGGGFALQWKLAGDPELAPAMGRISGKDGFDHYVLTTVPIPDSLRLEVGGLAFGAQGELYVCTRRGDVFRCADPRATRTEDLGITRWATGLHEPLGLLTETDGSLLIGQKAELTRARDTDGDGTADRFDTLANDWGLSGNYHEYTFGPIRDLQGNLWCTLNIGFPSGTGDALRYRGSAFRVTPEGRFEIACYGLRSPNGLVVHDSGAVFYTDNQGEWMDVCRISHLQDKHWYGHATALGWARQMPGFGWQQERTLPAIWIPYHLAKSVSWPVIDRTGGKFGPYAGQMIVGDQMNASLIRCTLQQVRGQWQGACYPFWRGFQCGVNRLLFDAHGELWAGQTERGWGSVGPKSYGLERLRWSGKTPFDLLEVRATRAGFELTFTAPIAAGFEQDKTRVYVREYGYKHWSTYGSDEFDSRDVDIEGVAASADRRTLTVVTGARGLAKAFQIQLRRLRSAAGEEPVTHEAFYTLLAIPD